MIIYVNYDHFYLLTSLIDTSVSVVDDVKVS